MSGGFSTAGGGGGTTLSGGTSGRLAKWSAADNIGSTDWAIGASNGELQYVGASKGTAAAPLLQIHASAATGLVVSDDAFNRLAFISNGFYAGEFTASGILRFYGGASRSNGSYIYSTSQGPEIGMLEAGQDRFNIRLPANASSFNLYCLTEGGTNLINLTRSISTNADGGCFFINGGGTSPSGGSSAIDTVDILACTGGGGVSFGGAYKKANGVTAVSRLDWTGARGTTTANSATTITGSSTIFEHQFGIGDYVALSSAASTFARITAIGSETSMTVNTALGDGTSQTFVRRQAPLHVKDRNEASILYCSPYGDVVMGAPGGAALATDATNGFLFIPTCAGAPSGTPETYTGRVPLVYDTTNNELYIYDGAWVSTSVFA